MYRIFVSGFLPDGAAIADGARAAGAAEQPRPLWRSDAAI
jgi:hypothetical protein